MDSQTNNPFSNLLKRELEPPNGLSLLVAALDAQDPKAFRISAAAGNNGVSTAAGNSGDYRISSNSPLTINTSISANNQQNNFRYSASPGEESQHSNTSSGEGRRRSLPDTDKTHGYWEKRRRNNEAAKKSREKRRNNDMAMEARVLELTKENEKLKDFVSKKQKFDSDASPPPPRPSYPPHLIGNIIRPPDFAAYNTAAHSLVLPPTPGSVAAVMPQLGAGGFAQRRHTSPPEILPPPPINPLLTAAANIPSYFLQAAAVAHHQRLQAAAMAAAAFAEQSRRSPAAAMTLKQQHSPDSTAADDVNRFNCAQSPSPFAANGAAAFFDPGNKQYLRYKLLERQNRLTLPPTTNSALLLGTLACNAAGDSAAAAINFPPQRQQQLQFTVTKTEADSLSLKDCLSSLAVSLAAGPSPSTTNYCQQPTNMIVCVNNGVNNNAAFSNHSSPRSDHGYDSQGRGSGSSGNGDTSCGDTSSNECGRSHSGSFSGGEENVGVGNGADFLPQSTKNVAAAADYPAVSCGDERRGSSDSSVSRRPSSSAGNSNFGGGGSGENKERYVERRRRNNEAAKKCRANRRALFEFRFQKSKELEQENGKLKEQIKRLTDELNELRVLLAAKQHRHVVVAEALNDSPLDFSKKRN